MNKAADAADLAELERMLAESGVGGAGRHPPRQGAESQGLGLFVRSLVGMDREAAKEALAGFLAGKTLEREPDRVREPDREPPDRARRDGAGDALRVAVHGLRRRDPTGCSPPRRWTNSSRCWNRSGRRRWRLDASAAASHDRWNKGGGNEQSSCAGGF